LAISTQAMELGIKEGPAGQRVRVDGRDVTDAIRSSEVTRAIYKLDQNSAVRRCLVALQRRFGEGQPTVAEGRDIGTVVFPKAKCKIYLDASLDERTRRRARQFEMKGVSVDCTELRAEIQERDEKSMNRADSPLRRAEDAVLLDTTALGPGEVVEAIARLARERL
jgi:cytidylate kinase